MRDERQHPPPGTHADSTAPTNAKSGGDEPTHVITCFLLRQDRGRDELLLVRRSDRVRTYRGHWAGISGYLEPGVAPEAQALTEIAEETGLVGEDIAMLRTGAPLPVADVAENLSWVVHPFLVLVTRPAQVRTDWEAYEFRWIAPPSLVEYPTVPGLAAALARVYPIAEPPASTEPAHG